MSRKEVHIEVLRRVENRFGPRLALTVAEASELLPVSEKKIYRLQDEGRFPLLRLDGQKLVPLGALLEWISGEGDDDGARSAAGDSPLGPTGPLRITPTLRAAAGEAHDAWMAD